MAALEIRAGAEARRTLLEQDLRPELFDVLVGASGGPKWLVISALDRLLFPWLAGGALRCVGSSIGAWRHLCLAQPDPAAALARLEEAYIDQSYSARPGPREVSDTCARMLAYVLGPDGARCVAAHPRLQSHIVVARGNGPWRSRRGAVLAAAAAATAGLNLLARPAIAALLERCCFHNGPPGTALRFTAMATRYVALREDNVFGAALASGSIPLVAAGVEELLPGEVCWDGGMTDYHFEPGFADTPRLTLYPHFYPRLTPGWFDKPLPWRRTAPARWPQLVLLSPSASFVASLPGGRIPDRRDFHRLETRERQRTWRRVAEAGLRLAEEFDGWRNGRGFTAALERGARR